MTYEDAGYDQFLLRSLEASSVAQTGNTTDVSGSQIQGDEITSLNGFMTVDLQNDRFYVNDGIINRVELGVLSDGAIGLIIRDAEGNELMHFSGDMNLIQSGDQSLSLNFNEAQLLVKNEGKIPVVLIGKQVGGF
jgi:hypothetical protein